MNLADSVEIHLDWWGKCRTCRFWRGDREKMTPGLCAMPRSDLVNTETWTEGHCKQWDSFDLNAAVAVMEREETKFGRLF